MDEESKGTLKLGETHPSTGSALGWYGVWCLNFQRYALMKESLASNAIEGNRLAEVCLETMERLEKHEPVSDRYLFGLVWFLRGIDDINDKDIEDTILPPQKPSRRVHSKKRL